MTDVLHVLLGCDWGTKVLLPGVRRPCPQRARQRYTIFGPGDEIHDLKLCDEHAAVVEAETDPWEEPLR